MFRLMSLSQWDTPIGLLNLLLTKASLETFASSQLDCWRKPLFCGSASTQQTLFREESVLLVEEVLFKDCVLISLESSIFSTLCRSFVSRALRFEVTRCYSNSGRTEEHDCSGALREIPHHASKTMTMWNSRRPDLGNMEGPQ